MKAQRVTGWMAIGLSTLLATLWAFWGILENFHQGWHGESWAENVGLLFVQYLCPLLFFLGLMAVSARWPRVGSVLHAGLALLALGFFGVGHSAPIVLIVMPLALLAALYWFGRPEPLRLAYAVGLGLPLLTLVACGVEPAWRVAGRVNDGNRGARVVVGSGVTLVWAPEGPGWSQDGVDWNEARRRCRYLADDGKALSTTPQEIWRLPTVEEAVRSMARHGRNCGGTWDPATARTTYRTRPDKESPLWDLHSQIIYWWTATEVDDEKAYIIVYDGKVWPRQKRARYGSLSFRAVKDPRQDQRVQR